ncbi:MAG: hypothetical protein IT161_02420 [Bryobacterales bacterium]|nr:hypothetical protein [Bryobacterales bacterium]
MPPFGLAAAEWKLLRSLKTPSRIQAFLDEDVHYNKEPFGPSCMSPRQVLRTRRAHCMEGALLAAAALRVLGHPPLLLDLEAQRDDDHVLALFRVDGCWGALAKSNYSGLRFREPVYRGLRELVMSYFESYWNLSGYKSLRGYSTRPVNLARFDSRGWMTSEEEVWYIPEYLCEVEHTPLLKPGRERTLSRVDGRGLAAGKVGRVE